MVSRERHQLPDEGRLLQHAEEAGSLDVTGQRHLGGSVDVDALSASGRWTIQFASLESMTKSTRRSVTL